MFFQFVVVCLKPEMTAPSLKAEKKGKADMCVRAVNWAKRRAELEIWDSNLKRKVIHFSEFLHKDYNSEDNEFVHYHLSFRHRSKLMHCCRSAFRCPMMSGNRMSHEGR